MSPNPWRAETTYHSHNDYGTHGGAGGERCYVGCHDHHQILLSHDSCLIVGWSHCGGGATGWRGCQGRLSNSRVVSSLKCFVVKVLLLAEWEQPSESCKIPQTCDWRFCSISFRALCALTEPKKRWTSAFQPSENWNSMFSWKSLQMVAKFRS